MYQDWMETVPLLIGGNASYAKENNIRELTRCAEYLSLIHI